MRRAAVLGLFLAILVARVAFPADGAANPSFEPTPVPAGTRAPITSSRETQGRILKSLAWPGFGELDQRRKLDKAQALVLTMERSSAMFDIGTTWRMLSAPEIPAYTANNGLSYPGAALSESQSPYSLFGRNRLGAVGFMVGGELAYSALAPLLPSLIERRWGESPGKAGKIARVVDLSTRVAGIGLGMYLTEEHVRWGAHNIRLTSGYLRDYDNYRNGLPPVVPLIGN